MNISLISNAVIVHVSPRHSRHTESCTANQFFVVSLSFPTNVSYSFVLLFSYVSQMPFDYTILVYHISCHILVKGADYKFPHFSFSYCHCSRPNTCLGSMSSDSLMSLFILTFNGLYAQKFEVLQIFSQLQKPVRTKSSVYKIIQFSYFIKLFLSIQSSSQLLKLYLQVLSKQNTNRTVK
jgi:hypothetical protein